MKWILCLVCLVVVSCGNSNASETEVKGIYCLENDCRSYRDCQVIAEGTGLECEPLEEAMGQKVAYCFTMDKDQGDGPEVNCHRRMKSCKSEREILTEGPFSSRLVKSCYTVTP